MKKQKPDPPARAIARDSVTPVYRRIRRMIMSGHLKSGQVLSQVQLALDFNTSRGPVREALRMLQKENLIEAEANQQGRIVSFSVEDIEQVSALLTLNAAVAIKLGAGKFSSSDVEAIERAIDRLEASDTMQAANGADAQRQTWRRQLTFRRLILLLAKHAGAQVTQSLTEFLDRLAMFRQFHTVVADALPPYPLSDRFSELRDAVRSQDAEAMARVIIAKNADLARRGIALVSPHYQTRLLDAYVDAAMSTLAGPGPMSEGAGIGAAEEMTIRVRTTPGARLELQILHGGNDGA